MKQKGWLQENVGSLLALIIVLFTFFIYMMILTKNISATENIVFLIIGGLTSLVTAVVGYFFGSSVGSKTKQAAMDRINDNTSTTTTTEINSVKGVDIENKTSE